MARQATPGDIEDIFLSVFVFHLALIVALVAVHLIGSFRMTLRAFAVGIPMVSREGMILNIDISPAVGVVAV